MRLVTRSDFDGLVCAVLLEEMGIIDDYLFVHPKDVQDGKIEVTANDVLTNIPYVPGCGLWFDHHSSEEERLELGQDFKFEGDSRHAPSCARVVYDYYGGAEKFSHLDETGLMAGVDQSDAAQFTVEEVLEPEGWVLLSFIMDARTGLGRYHDYRISNHALMKDMIQYCRTMTAKEIIEIDDVKERVIRYFEQEQTYEKMIQDNCRVDGNVLVINLLEVDEILSGNRFKEYVLYPEQNISIRVLWGRAKQNVVFTVGHNIVNRSCNTDVGSLMLKHGGGGHRVVGTCQVPVEKWESELADIIEVIKAAG